MLILVYLALSSLVVFNEAAPTTWKHPGVLVDGPRLQYIASQINVSGSIIATAYQKAIKSKYSNLTYTPQGPPAGGTIECGSYSDPDYGCTAASNDFTVAYLQLILYNLTKNTAYAANAIKVLNAYGHNLKKYNNSNAPLQAAWDASKYSRAAELATHLPGVNWAAADQTAFKTMFLNVTLPLIYPGSGANGNWELSMIEAMIGMSVWLENATLYDHAITYWNQRTPSYFYNYAADGNAPVPTPRGNPGWYGQTVFNASTNGHSQETCRDEGHTSMGQAAMINAAETAYIQGTDLYTQQMARIIGGIEYNDYWDLGTQTPPTYICNGTISLSTSPTYEIGYNAFVNRKNMSMPNTEKYLQKFTRAQTDPVNYLMMIYETLTHGGSPK